MTDNKVTITLTTGDTMEVHPNTLVLTVKGGDEPYAAIDAATYDWDVHAVFEPMREFWTPYEPWMRDVLADDARVSEMVGYEIRCTWGRLDGEDEDPDDADLRAVNLRVHPDDCPEQPAEDDPDEVLAEVLREVMADDWTATDLAHAAREHIAATGGAPTATRLAAEAAQRNYDAAQEQRERAEKSEADLARVTEERDALAERWGKSDADLTDATYELAGLRSEVDQWKHVATVRGKREVWLAKERDKYATQAEKWRARHAALREDVDEFHYKHREHPSTWELVDALARDTMRGERG